MTPLIRAHRPQRIILRKVARLASSGTVRLLVVTTGRVATRGIIRSAIDRCLPARAETLLLPRVRFRAGHLEDDEEQGSQRRDRGGDDQQIDLERVPEEEIDGDPGDVGELG